MGIGLRKLVDDRNARGTLVSLILVGGGAVLAFAMFSTAARVLGPEEFGHFATYFNVFSFLAVVAVLGQETLIARSWNEHIGNDRKGLAHGAARFGLHTIAFGIMATIALLIAVGFAVGLPPLLIACGAAFIAFFGVQNFLYQFTRAVAGNMVSDSLYEGVARTMTIAGLAAMMFAGTRIDAVQALWLLAAGYLVTALVMALVIWRRVPRQVWQDPPKYEAALWRERSSRMWLAAVLEGTSQYLDVIVINFLLGPVLAGSYFVATRIAAIFAKVTHAVNTRAAVQVSYFYYRREMHELDMLIRGMSIVSLAVIALGLPALAVLGKLLLPLFGEIYVREFPTLMVLAFGTAVTALAGPAPLILLHTGNEGLYSKSVLAGLVARMGLFAVLAPWAGTLGVAIGWSVTAIATALFLNFVARRRVGIDPSVLILSRSPLPAGRPDMP